jgi:hypothetical protein
MSLSRAWMTKLSAAAFAAVLAPGAMLVALVLLVIAGGFGGIGSLGQALSGPSLPATEPLPAATARRVALTPDHPAAPAAAGSAAIRAGVTHPTGAGHRSGPVTAASPAAPGTSSVSSPAAVSRPTFGRSPHPRRSASPVRSPNPATPVRTIVDQVVSAGQSVSKQLPGPAGPAVTQALQSVGSTADGVLTGPGPGPAGTSPR